MKLNNRNVEKILPVLESQFVDLQIQKTKDERFTGKLKLGDGVVVIQDKHLLTHKVRGVRRTFILIDLDETSIPANDYDKQKWLNSLLVLRWSEDGLRVVCVADKNGTEMEAGEYFQKLIH